MGIDFSSHGLTARGTIRDVPTRVRQKHPSTKVMIAKYTVAMGMLLTSAVLNASAASAATEKAPDLKDPKQRVSYSIGVDIGSNMKRQKLDLDPKALAAGLADALEGKPSLTAEEIRDTLMEFQKQEQAKAETRAKSAGEENLKAGKAFLEANGKKEGVKSTASGLQYKSLKAGTGKTPKASDSVKVHYTGKLLDGTVFDSSVTRGEPVTFGVGEVIKGWTEVLQLMKEGDKWQVYIPSDLAYRERGAGADIGPNATLIFDIELLSIEAGK